MKKKATNLPQVPGSMKRIMFAYLFFSAMIVPNLNAENLPEKNESPKEQVLQDNRISVKGTVTDTSGEPLIGVSIRVKNSTQGSITDVDGNYNVSVPNANSVLVFSYMGYATQEVTVGSNRTFNIVMKDDSQLLDQVVVTALGIKREKKALGYSVSSVSADDITKGGTPMNAASSLYGKAAGLQIGSTSAGSSKGMVIKIRNAMSLNEDSNTRPLVVVDGIPIRDTDSANEDRSIDGNLNRGSGFNDINPDDIESIEVLKGAKAAVLYGSEGANGVLLITTKSGSSRKGLGIDFSANYAVIKKAYGPEFQTKYGTGNSLGAGSYTNASTEGFFQRTDPASGKTVDSYWVGTTGAWGPRLDGRQILSYDDTYAAYKNYNGYDEMYRTGGQTAINVALSNSGEMGSYRFSYGYKDYKSIVLNSDTKTHNFAFAGDFKVNDFIKIKVNTSYNQMRDRNAPYRVQDLSSYGIAPDIDVAKIRRNLTTERGYSYYHEPTMKSNFPMGTRIGEYFWMQEQEWGRYKRDHFIQSLNVDVKLSDHVSWTTLGGLDYTDTHNETASPFKRPMTEDAAQGYYGLKRQNYATYYGQSTINYNVDLGPKWNLSAMGGGAVKRNTDEMQNTYIKREFATENYWSFTNTTNSNGPKAERERGKDLLLSLFASAQLAYDNQVYLEVQGRNDWSSILPPENNSYFYPGVSLSWIASETLKEHLPEVITFAKLRGSWADVGRPGTRYYGNVSFEQGSYGGQVTLEMPTYLPPADFATSTGGFPIPNLKPERKREFEVGLEAAFFPQNRIFVDFSWFHSNTYNQISSLPVPTSSGVEQVRMNVGNIRNTGIELAINTKPVITKDFQWTLGFNLANYGTKIIKLAKGIEQQELWGGYGGAKVFATLNGEYGEVFVRPWKVVEDENGNVIGRLVNANGNWERDTSKWKKVGKITPDVLGGVNTSLSYKGFTLSANLNFQFGGTLISQTNMYLLGSGTGKGSLKYRDEASGGLPYYRNTSNVNVLLDSHTAAIPSDSYYNTIMHDGVISQGYTADGKVNTKVISAQAYYANHYWSSDNLLTEDCIYKSDYISLRQITLSYDLPRAFAQKLKLQNARVTLFGDNLAYLYKDVPNTTPESTQGTNNFTEYDITPSTRSFGIGVNLTF